MAPFRVRPHDNHNNKRSERQRLPHDEDFRGREARGRASETMGDGGLPTPPVFHARRVAPASTTASGQTTVASRAARRAGRISARAGSEGKQCLCSTRRPRRAQEFQFFQLNTKFSS